MNPSSLDGVAACLRTLDLQNISIDDIFDDKEEEIEGIESSAAGLEGDGDVLNDRPIKRLKGSQPGVEDILEKNVDIASENVIVPSTLSEYRGLWVAFTSFCVARGLVAEENNCDDFWRGLPPKLPLWIAGWIMDKADDLDITTGKPKDLSIPRVTYARAQKMRAAVSHKFSREYKLGTQDWTESPLNPGTFSGNPSLSPLVSQYMVRAGEIVTSARAMDQETMRKLWEFNTRFPYKAELEQNSRKRKREQPERWAGHKVRQMLQTLYVISMLCLLRYDEALRIMWSDINFVCIGGTPVVELRLPFRKTDQNGGKHESLRYGPSAEENAGIAPFWLWPCPERPWMDAVTALARWWQLCSEMGVEQYGYVFRSRYLYDEISVRADHAMSTNSFLEYFRNNMLDIGIDPRPYGTHSFRRGGCQYLAKELRWPIRTICEWGGWAENFDNPGTIFRYLLSWVDTPAANRQDLFNPNRPGQDPCMACGRTCHCG
ncbi:hypothetical protein NUW54_g5454 [Trametes sanguinea]|uniref:Uncharacterized protein n=1 Tax=Trametes sanguinea TaxID=158606 RepID=A0ACC1PXS4_9APHY|nr:hypothetical protein NUW54_g5454 [Trametes sanguinea]